MTKGIIYLVSGNKMAVRLMVSLHSLKRHYGGPLTVLTAHMDRDYIDILHAAGIQTIPIDINIGHKEAQVAKSRLNQYAPYDRTIFLDADTLLLASPEPAFEYLDDYEIIFTQYHDWTASSRGIGARLRHLRQLEIIDEDTFQAAYKYEYGINIGFIGFRNDAAIWGTWPALAKAALAKNAFIPDEVTCQALLPKFNHVVLGTDWNSPCNRRRPTKDTVMLHFCGHKHMSIEKTRKHGTADAWRKYYQDMLVDNIWNIRSVIDRWNYRNERKFAAKVIGGCLNAYADESIQ